MSAPKKAKKRRSKRKTGRRVRPSDSAGFSQGGVDDRHISDYVVVELQHDSGVAYSPAGFEGPVAAESRTRSLNRVLESYPIKEMGSHMEVTRSHVRSLATAAPPDLRRAVSADFAHSAFVRIVPRRAADCASIVQRFNRSKSVWKAFVAPQPALPAAPTGASRTSRNFEPAQGYLHSAPNGIGAMAVWNRRGALGQRIRICDIEGAWRLDHEDLPAGIASFGGTIQTSATWRNHGTAVLGEMIGKPGTSGVVGISHRARGAVQSAFTGSLFTPAAAIRNATRRLRAGDVILIELHAIGPTKKYIAMQYWNDVFSAIRMATDKGITVVEAAGNGGENFQKTVFRNTGLQKDAGAIVVGAGIPPTNYMDYFGDDWTFAGFSRYGKIGVPRSRIWFSNYGKIVNVQAWGWHVTTLGYGDAQGGSSESRWYTHRFSGTSSASPIVAGAVACIQGRATAVRGAPLSPAAVRRLLIRTGTPQMRGPGVPLSQHIGPQPNMEKAIPRIRP